MLQEDKELLLKDLCARLPYGVKGRVKVDTVVPNRYDIDGFPVETTFDANVVLTRIDVNTFEIFVDSNTGNEDLDNYIWESQTYGSLWTIEEFEPYLRPMPNMTDEEKLEYLTVTRLQYNENEEPYRELTIEAVDWLNSHHFDYRGLIPMGLALEAPADMYKTE